MPAHTLPLRRPRLWCGARAEFLRTLSLTVPRRPLFVGIAQSLRAIGEAGGMPLQRARSSSVTGGAPVSVDQHDTGTSPGRVPDPGHEYATVSSSKSLVTSSGLMIVDMPGYLMPENVPGTRKRPNYHHPSTLLWHAHVRLPLCLVRRFPLNPLRWQAAQAAVSLLSLALSLSLSFTSDTHLLQCWCHLHLTLVCARDRACCGVLLPLWTCVPLGATVTATATRTTLDEVDAREDYDAVLPVGARAVSIDAAGGVGTEVDADLGGREYLCVGGLDDAEIDVDAEVDVDAGQPPASLSTPGHANSPYAVDDAGWAEDAADGVAGEVDVDAPDHDDAAGRQHRDSSDSGSSTDEDLHGAF